jgi:hypothetical protein
LNSRRQADASGRAPPAAMAEGPAANPASAALKTSSPCWRRLPQLG